MNRYYRYQKSGISFEDMKAHKSFHGDEQVDGVCAIDLIELTPNFGGSWGAFGDDGEVIIFEGYTVEEIYDGVIARPVREIARFTAQTWQAMIGNGTAWDWEA